MWTLILKILDMVWSDFSLDSMSQNTGDETDKLIIERRESATKIGPVVSYHSLGVIIFNQHSNYIIRFVPLPRPDLHVKTKKKHYRMQAEERVIASVNTSLIWVLTFTRYINHPFFIRSDFTLRCLSSQCQVGEREFMGYLGIEFSSAAAQMNGNVW